MYIRCDGAKQLVVNVAFGEMDMLPDPAVLNQKHDGDTILAYSKSPTAAVVVNSFL